MNSYAGIVINCCFNFGTAMIIYTMKNYHNNHCKNLNERLNKLENKIDLLTNNEINKKLLVNFTKNSDYY